MTDEWKTVTKQDKKRIAKGRKRPQNKIQHLSISEAHSTDWSDNSANIIVEQLNTYKCALKETDFSNILVEALGNAHVRPTQLVCFGIGNFARLRSGPLWQMSCALHLWDMMNPTRDDEASSSVYYFDPCMTLVEQRILRNLGIQVLTINERGKRNIQETPTIFFMPHCPMLLYFNMLFENWESLDKILLLGNSLISHTSQLGSTIPRGVQHLIPFIDEKPILYSKADLREMEGDFDRAFNDLFLTSFTCNMEEKIKKFEGIETEGEDEEVL
jgi:hypothetical protein